MECLKPNKGHYLPDGTHKFGKSRNGHETEHDIPCGYCPTCRTNKAKLRGFKSFTNTLYTNDNMFITLTFNDEHLPLSPSKLPTLDNQSIPLFIKRLRKFISNKEPDKKIGVLYCGEYGDQDQRPHYHIIIYNYKFNDQTYWRKTKKGFPQYRSSTLEKLWGKGNAEIGDVSPATCTYVASYIYKKQYGMNKKEYYKDRKPEYVVTPKQNYVSGREYIRQNINTISHHGCFKTIEGHSIGIDTHTLDWIKSKKGLNNAEAYKKIKLAKESFELQKLTKQEKQAIELTMEKLKELQNVR